MLSSTVRYPTNMSPLGELLLKEAAKRGLRPQEGKSAQPTND